MVSCQVCLKSDTASYKCPICRLPYCTTNCFQIHKESKCEQIENNTTENKIEIKEDISYATKDTLSTEKLKLLENDEELNKVLSNKHVRDILVGIDSCRNPNLLLEQAMKEPIFVEFVDACLRVVGESKEDDCI